MRQNNSGKRFKSKALKNLYKVIIVGSASVFAGVLLAAWLLPAVEAQRGYRAIGGEWFFIMLFAYAVGRFTYYFVCKDVQEK